ncbi:MAG: MoxR family ATPase [Planctomycetota bacterium]|nr:MoxR family ATPase [Planctomycetota bacterium]
MTVDHSTELAAGDVQAIGQLRDTIDQVKTELGRAVVGQQQVIDELLMCLIARGHALLMGVPGLAKTLLVSKLAECLSLDFSRIQFTPDLMPMDITGTDILQETPGGERRFEFVPGPIFANMVLADEINRAPAKTQAAMLEAMQEHRVTVLGKTLTLDAPFFVLATQNPVEQEGTYPLPEAQLDRFMFLIEVDYPDEAEEIAIARLTTAEDLPTLNKLLDGPRVLEIQSLVRRVPVPDHVYEYAARLVRQTRPQGGTAPDWLPPLVAWGAGPRAVQYLILGGKARAAMAGAYAVRMEDVQAVAAPVLRHRVLTTFAAESEGMSAASVVARLLEESAQV